jgi:hypothetical protein
MGFAFGDGVSRDESKHGDKTRNWREICEQIVKEKTPERFEELLVELLRILEERSPSDLVNRKM